MTGSRARWNILLAAAVSSLPLVLSPSVGGAAGEESAGSTIYPNPVSGLLDAELKGNNVLATSRALAPMTGMGTAGWQEAPWSTPRWQSPVLHLSEGGFTGDLWNGSTPEAIRGLVKHMPSARDSAVGYQLARRLLLSAAAPPKGVDDLTWQSLRVNRLANLGDLSGLQRLLAVLPAEEAGPLRERTLAEVALLTGDRETLCELSEAKDTVAVRDDFWQEIETVCVVERNDRNALRAHLEVLQQEGVDNETARLAWAILQEQPLGDALLIGMEDITLHATEAQLLPHFGFAQVEPLWHRISAGGRMALALDRLGDLRLRALATEWSVTTGRLPAGQLAAIYENFPFAEEDLRAGARADLSLSGPVERAFAWQSLLQLNDPRDRLVLLETALDAARTDRCYVGAAAVLLPQLDFSPESAALPGTSDIAGRALYVMGRYEEATAWMLVARRESTISARAANASWRLWPYARLAGLALPNDTTGLIAWRSTQNYEPEELVSAREALLLELLRALGDGFPQGWLTAPQLAPASSTPASDSAAALLAAGSSGHLGETLLRVLIMIDSYHRGEADAESIALAVEALDRVGLPLEARALAIETAHEAGI